MKNQFTSRIVKLSLLFVVFFAAISCSEDMIEENLSTENAVITNNLNARTALASELPLSSTGTTYTITLESVTNNGNGTFTWTWSALNPNFGNGNDGTVQNLSHWDITLGNCVIFDNVVSGTISTDGSNWSAFTPTWEQDNSLWRTCDVDTGNVLKFNVGTEGSAKTYYRLTIDKDVEIDTEILAYYKSGNNTPCGTLTFPGFGCERVIDEGCSMSQGFYFASQNAVWTDVTVGSKNYTKAQGLAIWNSSNKGGIADSKKGFLQVAAIKLSGSTVLPSATVLADVAIVEAWLADLPQLTPTSKYSNAAASAAAGRIGDWINANHCE